MSARGCGCGAVVAMASLAGGAAAGAPMRGPRLAEESPIALRGGVMMAPLVAEVEGDNWPDEMTLVLEDLRQVRGLVSWVHPRTPGPQAVGWTDDPRGLAVRRITAADDASVPGAGAVYLLVRLPADAGGTLRLGGQVIHPRWMDGVAPRLATGGAGPGPAAAAPGEPDDSSPFERWRYEVLARWSEPGPPPPPLPGDAAAPLVASHYAGLWCTGLERLQSFNSVVYRDVMILLTRRVRDGDRTIAAWSARPDEVTKLLEILIDPQRSERQVVVEARRWCDEKSLLAFRLPASDAGNVMVAVVNPGAAALPARFRWLGRADDAARLDLAAGALCRVPVPRSPEPVEPPEPALPPDPAGVAAVSVLLIEAGEQTARLTFPERPLPARPPGVLFALRPALTLAEVQSGWQRGAAPQRSTQIQVRRLAGRWEIFAECRRPGGPALEGQPMPGLERMRGIEAITLMLGGEPAPVYLAIPERGTWKLWRGADHGALEVYRRSCADTWFCRVVLPDSWLPPGGRLLVGAARSHGDGPALETGPYAALPWEPDPGRAVIDTTTWDGSDAR